MEHLLWYRGPADVWTDALPLGNGRLGAMCFGGAAEDRFQLNESTVWSGTPGNEQAETVVDAETARSALAAARTAVDAGDFVEADAQVRRLQQGYPQSYLAFSDLHLVTRLPGGPAEVLDHRRSLSLDTATHTSRYRVGGHEVRREAFLSRYHDVLVVVTTTDAPDGLDLDVTLSSPLRRLRELGGTAVGAPVGLLLRAPADVAPTYDQVPEPIRYSEDPAASVQAAVALTLEHDGREAVATREPGTVVRSVRGAHRVVLVLTADTTFAGIGRPPHVDVDRCWQTVQQRLEQASRDGLGQVRYQHRAAHAELYGRSSLDLPAPAEVLARPTDERLAAVQSGERATPGADPGLVALLFGYGRYLFVSSSRPGGPPPNLQGIWNDQLQPPWSSDYTVNINLQMNYWLAELTGLPDLVEPLFDLVDALAEHGRETAARLYDAPGWVAHHCTDLWAYTQPVGDGTHDPTWAFWPLAGAWLGRHLWDHLRFGADVTFARDRAWPVLRSAAEFFLAWLVERPDGSLGTSPSTSPENHFRTGDRTPAATTASATMDLSLISDLFTSVVELAGLLQIDDPLVARVRSARDRLLPVGVGRDGLLREWADDHEAVDPAHRHMAHLYLLHPSDAPVSDELAAAAARSLDARGDDATGWSLVWKVCLQARLGRAHRVDDLMALLFRDMASDRGPWSGGLYRNLFMAHPPFQVDGNLGYVAAVAECLVQSHRGCIELLPALPAVMPSGSVTGIVARPGVVVDLEWSAGELVAVTLRSRTGGASGRHTVVHGGRSLFVDVREDRSTTLTAADFAR